MGKAANSNPSNANGASQAPARLQSEAVMR
jgi:hypothetical protein